VPIDGATRIYAVIGDPIAAVRSPEWFNTLFERRRVNAVLVPLHVAREDLAAAFHGLRAIRNLDGLVVTMPHKGPMCALLDVLSPAARAVGAVNVARRDASGRWVGDMFDGRGCVQGLKRQGHEVTGRAVFLLGAGAAGAAIAYALAEAGVRALDIDDHDVERCNIVADTVRRAFPQVQVRRASLDAASPPDLAINATPLGMRPGDPMPFDPELLPSSTLVVDVITKPEVTPLLARALSTGHHVHTGGFMHEGQALHAALFFGFDPQR
jgi:shikimate dehydrogenase